LYGYQITKAWELINDEAVEFGNEKHWREFLSRKYLDNPDPSITMAYS